MNKSNVTKIANGVETIVKYYLNYAAEEDAIFSNNDLTQDAKFRRVAAAKETFNTMVGYNCLEIARVLRTMADELQNSNLNFNDTFLPVAMELVKNNQTPYKAVEQIVERYRDNVVTMQLLESVAHPELKGCFTRYIARPSVVDELLKTAGKIEEYEMFGAPKVAVSVAGRALDLARQCNSMYQLGVDFDHGSIREARDVIMKCYVSNK